MTKSTWRAMDVDALARETRGWPVLPLAWRHAVQPGMAVLALFQRADAEPRGPRTPAWCLVTKRVGARYAVQMLESVADVPALAEGTRVTLGAEHIRDVRMPDAFAGILEQQSADADDADHENDVCDDCAAGCGCCVQCGDELPAGAPVPRHEQSLAFDGPHGRVLRTRGTVS